MLILYEFLLALLGKTVNKPLCCPVTNYKGGCAFMVIWSEFRMEQYGVDDHREDASHFRHFRCQGYSSTEVRECSTAAVVKKRLPYDSFIMECQMTRNQFSDSRGVGGARSPSQHFSIFSIGSPTSIPTSPTPKKSEN